MRPGEEIGEIFFGGKGSGSGFYGKGYGSGLDQLHYPAAITFYKEEAYIVDKLNDRVLKVKSGEERGEIFFGGKGHGSGLDQLKYPLAITFYKEMPTLWTI